MFDEPTGDIASSWQLCTNCEKIVLRDDLPVFQVALDEHGEAHHVFTEQNTWIWTDFYLEDEFPNLPSLLESSDDCTLCKYFREILSSDQALAAFECGIQPLPFNSQIPIECRVYFAWDFVHTNERQYLVLEVSFSGTHETLTLFCTIQATDECKELAGWLGLSQQTHDLFTNKETIDWMRSELNHCSERHDCGADLLESEYLPDRLIDVRQDVPRLVFGADIRSSHETNPRYVALSYCWGIEGDASNEPKANLTEESIHEFQTGIGDQKLSAVHRDAVSVAKALCIPYIWIDALCILQDDRDDWERQCEQMHKIYGCAYVTILAAASTSSRESFLRRPCGLHTRIPFRSSRQSSRNGSLQIELRKVTSLDRFQEAGTFLHDDLSFSRLSTRGWAYQESVLSTRRILFGEWNIHLLCSNSHQTLNGLENRFNYDTTMDQIKQLLSQGNDRTAWELVFKAATRYGNASFTYPEDILPALSGLARLIQKDGVGVYLAGHWDHDLFFSLMWERSLQTVTSKERHFNSIFGPGPYTVPSWSILCKEYVELAVKLRSFEDLTPEVQSCVGQVALVGKNPFGAINYAHLEIRSHSFRNHTHFGQSITLRSFDGSSGRNAWHAVIGWGRRHFYSVVLLDYHLQKLDISQDPRMWRWLLLGSTHIQMVEGNPAPSTDNRQSHASQTECQEAEEPSESDDGYPGRDDQEPRSSNSDVGISDPSCQFECSYLRESEEGLAPHCHKDDQRYESNLNNDQNVQHLADASGAGNTKDSFPESGTEPERYPYGLLLFQGPGQQVWYRVGVFTPKTYLPKQHSKLGLRDGLELMTLHDFKGMSQMMTLTIV